jgi:hypothetical protein
VTENADVVVVDGGGGGGGGGGGFRAVRDTNARTCRRR